jgi:hypothetical protein
MLGPHLSGMRRTLTLVRCLDCRTEYWLDSHGGEAGSCPHCGGVGWVAVDAVSGSPVQQRSAAKRKFR